jgi:hypothetical protein
MAVETKEHCGREVRRRFRLRQKEVAVVELLDQWFGSGYRYCKVQGSDGAIYILRLNEPTLQGLNFSVNASMSRRDAPPQHARNMKYDCSD